MVYARMIQKKYKLKTMGWSREDQLFLLSLKGMVTSSCPLTRINLVTLYEDTSYINDAPLPLYYSRLR